MWRLGFGIELELLLEAKPPLTCQRWDDVARELSTMLTAASIPNAIAQQGVQLDYTRWNIDEDGSIATRRNIEPRQWGVELISDVCITSGKETDWKDVQRKVWQLLKSKFIVVPSESCGTHVHVSLARPSGWGKPDRRTLRLKRVAKAVVYFERCIDSLMPEHRLHNRFCRSNRYNPILRDLSIREVFEKIDAVPDLQRLGDILSPPWSQTASATTDNVTYESPRYYRWNFWKMTGPKPYAATVEFRQAPGSTDMHEARLWPQLVLAFVTGAMQHHLWNKPIHWNRVPTFDDLRAVLRLGCNTTRTLTYERLETLFNGRTKLPEGMYSEAALSPEDTALMRRKQRVVAVTNAQLESAEDAWPFGDLLMDANEDEEAE